VRRSGKRVAVSTVGVWSDFQLPTIISVERVLPLVVRLKGGTYPLMSHGVPVLNCGHGRIAGRSLQSIPAEMECPA
jgi:hypothetical protein